MKKRIIYFFVATAFVINIVSCNKWLDVKPRAQIDREEEFSSELGFMDALTGCYIKMKSRHLYGTKLTMTTIEYLAQNWETTGEGSVEQALMDFNYKAKSSADTIQSIYANLYNTLVQVNDILSYIDKKKDVFQTSDNYNIIKGETLALRGFLHLDILRLFGQLQNGGQKEVKLPYQDRVSKDAIIYSTNSEFIAKIEADLIAAEKLLLESDPVIKNNISTNSTLNYFSFRRFRFNYFAVKATQARLYLYVNQYVKANDAAMTVINAVDDSGVAQFKMNSGLAFATDNYSLSNESIVCLSVSNLNDIFNLHFNSSTLVSQNEQRVRDDLYGEASTSNRLGIWNRYYDKNNQPKFTSKKYAQTNDITSDEALINRQTIPLIRLSEMYLIAMETMSYTQAQPLYNVYIADRSLSERQFTNDEQKKEEIIKEYRREFIAEGQMFYLYKRIGARNMLWRPLEVVEDNYILPLPTREYNPSI